MKDKVNIGSYNVMIVCSFLHLVSIQLVSTRDGYVGGVFYRTNSRLLVVPSDIPSDAVEVHLNNNMISHLRSGNLSHLSSCTVLNFQNNLIRTIEDNAFLGLGNLAMLNLRENKLTTLKKNMFNGLSSMVEHIDFVGNDVDTIESGCFSDLNKMKYLSFGRNDLTEVSGTMWQGLQSLKRLDLFGNSIVELKAGDFSHLPNLEVLLLHGNRIRTISPDIFNPTEYLSLDGHPHNLQLSLGSMQCDTRLCWLKQAERLGWITWWDKWGSIIHPECVNYPESWDELDLKCPHAGNL